MLAWRHVTIHCAVILIFNFYAHLLRFGFKKLRGLVKKKKLSYAQKQRVNVFLGRLNDRAIH